MLNKRQKTIKILVWIGLRFPSKFIRELAKIEYGVSYYISHLADELPQYRQQFLYHANQEKYHGRMLAGLVGEPTEKEGGLAKKRWAYTPFAGGTQIEGVGRRYFVMRKILKGKSLNEYPLIDRLSIMAALESIALAVYQEIISQSDSPLREIAAKIAEDEANHHNYLTELLALLEDDLFTAIEWEKRIIDAVPYALLDAPKLFMSNNNGNKSTNS